MPALEGRRCRLLPGALARRRRLRGPDARGGRRRSARRPPRRACARSSTSAGSAPRAPTCPPTCARGARSRACSARPACRSRCCGRRSWSGRGGISWELTRQLVKNLPAMVVPKWVATRTQPIAVDDVIRYLVGVADEPEALGRVFEIGGPDQLTYLEMLQVAAEVIDGHRGADRQGAGADAAALVVLARPRHRRRRHHRPQPDRLDGHRGAGHRPLDPRLVPGEPMPYAEAVGVRSRTPRTRAEAISAHSARNGAEVGQGCRSGGPRFSRRARAGRGRASSRPDDVGDDRGQDAAGGAALEPDHGAEQHRGEGEHHVARGQRGERRTPRSSPTTG